MSLRRTATLAANPHVTPFSTSLRAGIDLHAHLLPGAVFQRDIIAITSASHIDIAGGIGGDSGGDPAVVPSYPEYVSTRIGDHRCVVRSSGAHITIARHIDIAGGIGRDGGDRRPIATMSQERSIQKRRDQESTGIEWRGRSTVKIQP